MGEQKVYETCLQTKRAYDKCLREGGDVTVPKEEFQARLQNLLAQLVKQQMLDEYGVLKRGNGAIHFLKRAEELAPNANLAEQAQRKDPK